MRKLDRFPAQSHLAVELLVFHLSLWVWSSHHISMCLEVPQHQSEMTAVLVSRAFLQSHGSQLSSDPAQIQSGAVCLLLVPTVDEDGEAVSDFCKREIFLLEVKLLLSSYSGRMSRREPETSIWKPSPVFCNGTRLLGNFSPQISPHFPM